MAKPWREPTPFGKRFGCGRCWPNERECQEWLTMIERAVRDFLNALGPEMRRSAVSPFEAEERWNWHYIPKARNGVALKSMSETQRQAAMALLRAALSERGYARAED